MDSGDSIDSEDYDIFEVLQSVRDNDPTTTALLLSGRDRFTENINITNEQWEEIGYDISNNTHLKHLLLIHTDALNDEKMAYLFRGLTSSSSIKKLDLYDNALSAVEVRSMLPFLTNASNLRTLNLDDNNIHSEGFNTLLRALRDSGSPIEKLSCMSCGIQSIADADYFPRKLNTLFLSHNHINADGCRELAKLLRGGDPTLKHLSLANNEIDDEGAAILIDALISNTSLSSLVLHENSGISDRGKMMFLKLVDDISSIKATLQSNHTLKYISLMDDIKNLTCKTLLERRIDMATNINATNVGNPEAAGREKIIQTQLHSATRATLAELEGVNQSVYSQINPLHLPEVLSLVGRRHGQKELYIALKSSVAGVTSIVNKEQYFKEQLAYHQAKSAEMHAQLAALKSAKADVLHSRDNESRRSKRRRKWLWGLFGWE